MIPRRALLAAAPLALAGCRNREEAYFEKTDPPRTMVPPRPTSIGTVKPPSPCRCLRRSGPAGGLKDPTWFLGMFKAQSGASGTGWHDPHYDDLLTAAKTTIAPVARMRKLAACEPCLLRAMPCLPLYSDAWVYLCKPFVKGLAGDPVHGRMLNDVRIDPTWRSR